MIRKEFIQTLREPRMRMMLFMPPLIQLLIFGFAVNLDVDSARIAWMDQDRTPESRELLSEFEGSGRFAIVATPQGEKEMQGLLDRSKVDGVVRVLPGFAHDLERGRTTSVQVLLDGTNSNTASIVSGYAGQTILRYSSEVMDRRQRDKLVAGTMASGGPLHAAVPQVDRATRVWFNPDLRSRNYFVPGVVVNIIMLVTLSLTAMAIVREKEIGTMEQLMVTPIRPVELILGKTLPFVLIGFWDLVLIVGASLLIFHVPFAGQLRNAVPGGVFLHPDQAGRGPVHLHGFKNAAAGQHVDVPVLPAVHDAEWIRVPDSQHAHRGAVFHVSRSDALLSGDRARHFPERLGLCSPMAANAGAGRFRSGGAGVERTALPQAIGLDAAGSCASISRVRTHRLIS